MMTVLQVLHELNQAIAIDPNMPLFTGKDGELMLVEMRIEGEGDERYVAMTFVDPMERPPKSTNGGP